MSALRTLVSATAILGLGFWSWSVAAPGEDRRMTILKNLPESNQWRMDEAKKRNALVMQAIKESAKINDNILGEGPKK